MFWCHAADSLPGLLPMVLLAQAKNVLVLDKTAGFIFHTLSTYGKSVDINLTHWKQDPLPKLSVSRPCGRE